MAASVSIGSDLVQFALLLAHRELVAIGEVARLRLALASRLRFEVVRRLLRAVDLCGDFGVEDDVIRGAEQGAEERADADLSGAAAGG